MAESFSVSVLLPFFLFLPNNFSALQFVNRPDSWSLVQYLSLEKLEKVFRDLVDFRVRAGSYFKSCC